MNRNVLQAARMAFAAERASRTRPTLVEAADRSAAIRPPWWRWTAYLAAAAAETRIAHILATGKDVRP